MPNLGPWGEQLMAGRKEPPTVEQIRKLALTSLRMRGWLFVMTIFSTVFACWIALHLKVPPLNALVLMVAVLLQAIPFARKYLPMVRQWRDLGDSHRDLGLTRLHYASLAMDSAMLLVPAIGAGILLAYACGSFG